jgi:hypothetical protein
MAIASALYCGVLVFTGIVIARAPLKADPTDSTRGVTRTLTATILLSSVFFLSYFALGILELFTGVSLVTPIGAALIGIPLSLGIAIIAGRRRKSSHSASDNPRPARTQNGKLSRYTLLLFAMSFAALSIILLPIFPMGYEGLAKHLSMGHHFLQSQTLTMWDHNGSHAYPANVSLYFAFLMSFLPERFLTLANVAFTALLCVAMYGLAYRLSSDQAAARWVVVGTLTIPLIAFNVFESAADLGGIAFLAAAVYFIIYRPRSIVSWPLLAGLAAGLAFGFKPLHLVSIAYLGAIVLIVSWNAMRAATSRGISTTIIPASQFTIATLVMAGYWLSRNYVFFGNPLYPVHFSFFNILGWPGPTAMFVDPTRDFQVEWVRRSSEWLLYPWLEWHESNQNFKSTSGVGMFFAATVPLSTLAAALGVTGIIRSSWQTRIRLLTLLGGALIVLAAWWILARQPRYALGAFVFLLPLVAWTISQTQGRARVLLETTLSIAAVVMLFVVSSAMLVEVGDRLIYSQQFARAAYYEYPEAVDHLPSGSTILNLGERRWNYRLHGSGLKNRVVSFRETTRLLASVDSDVNSAAQRLYRCRQTSASSAQEHTDFDGRPACRYDLDTDILRRQNATHIFVLGAPWIESDGCTQLREVDRLDKNPVNDNPLPEPRILYEIVYC